MLQRADCGVPGLLPLLFSCPVAGGVAWSVVDVCVYLLDDTQRERQMTAALTREIC